VPLPVRATNCCPPLALSRRVRVPVLVPAAEGVKVTLTVHEASAPSVAGRVPQVFVSAKSPLTPIEFIVRALVPVFCTITVWAVLVLPTASLPKARLEGASVILGAVAVPLPVRAINC